MRRLAVSVPLLLALVSVAAADEPAVVAVMQDVLVLEPVGRHGRQPVHADAVEHALVTGRWAGARAGDVVTPPDGPVRRWSEATAGDDGWLHHAALRGGWVRWSVDAPYEQVVLLDARGHSAAYLNGVPRPGTPYATGFLQVPIRLRAGANELLFRVGRGRLWARLVEPTAPVMLLPHDRTLPEPVTGSPIFTVGGLVLANARVTAADDLVLAVTVDGGETRRVGVGPVAPLATRKVVVPLVGSPPPAGAERVGVTVELLEPTDDRRERILATDTFDLTVRGPDDVRVETFTSAVDGTAQEYAVRPAAPPAGDVPVVPGLVLSLHGAGVDCRGQAASYSARPWCHVVAATNRRPFGFDWEDWGRLDALEVLETASARLGTDPMHTWLTGHSMGGHGTWHVGVTFPDRFAAIAPSAGWVSFWSYTGAAAYEDADAIESILRRATSPSDTLALADNLDGLGVFILHGDADDNVPVEQARIMRGRLGGFHRDFVYEERPGAGHWWGNACVNWPPLFDFLERHVRPEPASVRRVRFATASPGVSASRHWATVHRQLRPFMPSRIDLAFDPKAGALTGTTENVALLEIDAATAPRPGASDEPPTALRVELDGADGVEAPWPPADGVLRLARADDGAWTVAGPPDPALKGPHRSGAFKDVYRRRAVLVYATGGDEDANARALAQARLHAETFRYRGNGDFPAIADVDFDPAADPDRNVVLYGNAETNRAWSALLGASPVQVRDGAVTIGANRLAGDDLGVLLIRPRPGSAVACVGAVAGTGPSGDRVTMGLPIFVSGVAYPDVTVIRADALRDGTQGVVAAGWFGGDWSVEGGEFAFR